MDGAVSCAVRAHVVRAAAEAVEIRVAVLASHFGRGGVWTIDDVAVGRACRGMNAALDRWIAVGGVLGLVSVTAIGCGACIVADATDSFAVVIELVVWEVSWALAATAVVVALLAVEIRVALIACVVLDETDRVLAIVLGNANLVVDVAGRVDAVVFSGPIESGYDVGVGGVSGSDAHVRRDA